MRFRFNEKDELTLDVTADGFSREGDGFKKDIRKASSQVFNKMDFIFPKTFQVDLTSRTDKGVAVVQDIERILCSNFKIAKDLLNGAGGVVGRVRKIMKGLILPKELLSLKGG